MINYAVRTTAMPPHPHPQASLGRAGQHESGCIQLPPPPLTRAHGQGDPQGASEGCGHRTTLTARDLQENQPNATHMRRKWSQPSCRTYMTIFDPFLASDERLLVGAPWPWHPVPSGRFPCTLDLHVQKETTHRVLRARGN